jgi:hypothetical protein
MTWGGDHGPVTKYTIDASGSTAVQSHPAGVVPIQTLHQALGLNGAWTATVGAPTSDGQYVITFYDAMGRSAARVFKVVN